jgi:hypothetical protein
MSNIEAKLKELREANPGVEFTILSAAGESIIVKPVSRMAWKQFRAAMESGAKGNDQMEILVAACTVFPDRDGVLALFERRPALAETFGNRLARDAGFNAEVEAKKE